LQTIKVKQLLQLLNKIIKFYILSNLHVAFSVFSLYAIFNDKINVFYAIFLVSSTVLSYNLIRIFSFRSIRFFIKRFMATYKLIFFSAILLSSILSLFSYYYLPLRTKLILIPFMAMTLFYNLDAKWLPINRLRSNGIVKIMVVAIVWTGIVIIVPHFEYSYFTNKKWFFLLKTAFVFIYIMMLTMSFDQRDLLIDDKNLKTLPQLYKNKLFYFYVVFNILLTLISINIFDTDWQLVISIIMINLSTFLCLKSTEHKSFYYTAFWIEGLPILWYFFSFIA